MNRHQRRLRGQTRGPNQSREDCLLADQEQGLRRQMDLALAFLRDAVLSWYIRYTTEIQQSFMLLVVG